MLEVSNINAFYSDFHVLHDASLKVNKGELVAVVGANGHGKSTLLKAICGLTPVKSGKIRFADHDTTSRRAPHLVSQGLVYVAEDRRLFPDMTVLENLQLGAYLAQARAQEKRNLDHVFSLYPRLAERRHQLCRSLSGGEAQMVALGRGLMSNPTLLAIDEPSLGLAPNLTETMLQTVSQLNRDGLTVLLVEQSLALLKGMIDRVYTIEEGTVSETDTDNMQEVL
ncbi:ABC transporter ATP-binding protein (plasmid) [Aliisedimentitalea scapharcae]|uniref:ABC transporter ATP-binding protein n=1 Tax=Aliisedimentitalea scapharcae TaxID=1524259 RepID=A0ABZ2XZZ9_9RHOB|nr:ABC transporter ATP-binding protein [Rhodobacteraceae bacterium M382]